jgi:hypothetical protein
VDPDPDADPAIFVIDIQDANKKLILKIKSPKEVTKQYESWVFLLFLLDDRRIRSRIRIHTSTSGSGSGAGRTKNMWIRIRNTG